MKKMALIFCLIASPVIADSNKSNSTMIKDCLEVWGMDYELPVEERFARINWNNASACVSNFIVEDHQNKVKADREFVNKHPWFKGKNWKWQDKAEYTCTKQLHSGFTVCHKPIYLN